MDPDLSMMATTALRGLCELIAGSDAILLSVTITLRLDPSPGSAMALQRQAAALAWEYKLANAMVVTSHGRSTTIRFWRVQHPVDRSVSTERHGRQAPAEGPAG